MELGDTDVGESWDDSKARELVSIPEVHHQGEVCGMVVGDIGK